MNFFYQTVFLSALIFNSAHITGMEKPYTNKGIHKKEICILLKKHYRNKDLNEIANIIRDNPRKTKFTKKEFYKKNQTLQKNTKKQIID
jgi:hypothetical protein